MKNPLPEDLMWDAQRIARAVIEWVHFDGFTAETCGSCRATANVLAFGPGWFCPCGGYNVQSWNHHQIPHVQPTYGPPQETIKNGFDSVRYAFYSAEADALQGHCVYKLKGKEVLVTLVDTKKDGAKGWPDAVLLGQVTTYDCVRGNNHYLNSRGKNFLMEEMYNKYIRSYDQYGKMFALPKGLLDDLIIKIPPPPKREEKLTILSIGDHEVPSIGYQLTDGRLEVTATWQNADGKRFVRVKTSAKFRRLYGPDAIPVYNEPGVEARWPKKEEPKGRYRWIGTKYAYEPK